jgi:hypothetical protein
MAPPIALPGYALNFDAASVPMRVIHGWHDELIPAQAVVDWCATRAADLRLLNDGHRLERHIEDIKADFAQFLGALA